LAVEYLVKHGRASGHMHIAHAGAFPVLLVRDHHAVLIDALPCLDAAFQCVLPDVNPFLSCSVIVP
jgi:hypothetical protein